MLHYQESLKDERGYQKPDIQLVFIMKGRQVEQTSDCLYAEVWNKIKGSQGNAWSTWWTDGPYFCMGDLKLLLKTSEIQVGIKNTVQVKEKTYK